MDKVTTITGVAAPLMRRNVDTDAIIPSREMKQVSKKGLSVGLFAGWRYLDSARTPNPDFILNQDTYRDAPILLSGANFGCGSSREHAVWALSEFGIKAIIAPSFSNIFYNNCIRNGLLPIRLSEDEIELIIAMGGEVAIDLTTCIIRLGNQTYSFDIEPANQDILLEGRDPMSELVAAKDEIEAFIHADKIKRAWAYL